MTFNSSFRIHFNDADPAGIAFFGNVFHKIHQVYEDFLNEMGMDLKEWFLNPKIIAPIRQTEAEYFRPLLPLESYDVKVSVLKLSESTFRLQFDIQKESQSHVKVTTTHVCCALPEMKKTSIPEPLKLALEKFL